MEPDSFFKRIGHHSVSFNEIYKAFVLNDLRPHINLEHKESPSEVKVILGLGREVLRDKSKYNNFRITIQNLKEKSYIKDFKIIHLPEESLGRNFIDFEKINNPKKIKNMFSQDYGVEIKDHHGLEIDISFSNYNHLDKHWYSVDKDSFFNFFVKSVLNYKS